MYPSNNARGASRRHYLNILIYMLTDYVALVGALELSYHLRELFAPFLSTVFVLYPSYKFIYIPVLYLICISMVGGYGFNRPSVNVAKDVLKGLVYSFILCFFVLFVIHTTNRLSRLYAALFFITSIISVGTLRLLVGMYLKKMPWIKEDVIVLGAGKTAEGIREYFSRDLTYRYRVLGIVDDDPVSAELAHDYPLLGGFDRVEPIIREQGVQTVIFSAPGMEKAKREELLNTIQPLVRNILYVPDFIGTPLGGVQVQTLFTQQITILKVRNNLARMRNRILKRSFDLVLTLLAMPVILPVLALLAIVVKMDSEGPAFYNAERLGIDGTTFKCFKFRSMYTDGDARLEKYLAENPEAAKEWKEYAKLRGYDPRVTKAGNFMRKTSLDELPQLINVLLGDMSLVGPRPYLPREKADMGEAVYTVTMITPGITGFWQVSGRNDVTFQGRVQMDVWYVRNWSVWMDLWFLLKTVKIVLLRSGAY